MYTFKILQRNSLSLDQCLRLTPIDRKCYADDVTLPAQGTGTTTPTVATDEVASRHPSFTAQRFDLCYQSECGKLDPESEL